MELIKVQQGQIGPDAVQTVNARELHAFLEVGKDFSNWIKDRITAYDFVEDRDFVRSPVLASEGRGGHNRLDYHLTLDMAKELAMVERNEKGKQARTYFIECERKLKDAMTFNPATVLESPAAMRGLLLTYTEKVLALEADKAALVPKVEAFDRIASVTDGSFSLTAASKVLQMKRDDLTRWLHANGWIYRFRNTNAWLGYETKVRAMLIEHKVHEYTRDDGTKGINTYAHLTPKGIAKVAELLQKPHAA